MVRPAPGACARVGPLGAPPSGAPALGTPRPGALGAPPSGAPAFGAPRPGPPGEPASGVPLSGLVCSGAALSGAFCSGALLSGAALSETLLSGALRSGVGADMEGEVPVGRATGSTGAGTCGAETGTPGAPRPGAPASGTPASSPSGVGVSGWSGVGAGWVRACRSSSRVRSSRLSGPPGTWARRSDSTCGVSGGPRGETASRSARLRGSNTSNPRLRSLARSGESVSTTRIRSNRSP